MVVDWTALTLFLLITGRMTGCVAFNPIFGRRGIPAMVKAGFILLLSVSVFAITPVRLEMPATLLGLVLTFLLEMFLGYVLGLVISLFFYVPMMAGAVIDAQMGMSMGATYDPASGAQITVLRGQRTPHPDPHFCGVRTGCPLWGGGPGDGPLRRRH